MTKNDIWHIKHKDIQNNLVRNSDTMKRVIGPEQMQKRILCNYNF